MVSGFALVLVIVAQSTAVGTQEPPSPCRYRRDIAQLVDMRIDASLPVLLQMFRDLHAHPELSLAEHETSRKVAMQLSAAGFEVTQGVGGTGVVGVLANGPGPVVMLRGDMDALPVTEETSLPYRSEVTATNAQGASIGVMHACGHDMHTTCLVGTARVLAATKSVWRGTVVVVAQPAEEIGVGARAMLADGLFERFPKPDYCLALHVSAADPAGVLGYTSGAAFANVDSVDIRIHGRGGHGSAPHLTVDPVVTAAQVVVALQTLVSRRLDPLEAGVITVGSIHAGTTHNIIPADAVMQLTVRSYNDRTRRLLLDGIREITLHTCRAFGCPGDPEVAVREEFHTPAAYNDPRLVDAAVGVLREVFGSESVVEQPPAMVGEDFGRYPRAAGVPGFLFRLGAVRHSVWQESQESGESLPTLHSGRFEIDPEPTLRAGMRAMTSLALSILRDV